MISQMKTQSREIYDTIPYPTNKEEEWKYTRLPPKELFSSAVKEPDITFIGDNGIAFHKIVPEKESGLRIAKLSRLIKPSDGKFQAFSSAFMSGGYFIRVPTGLVNQKLYQAKIRSENSAMRNLIVIEKNTSISLFEDLSSKGGFGVSATEIFLGENSTLNYYISQQSVESNVISYKKAFCGKKSKINWFLYLKGGNLNKIRLDTILKGEKASTETFGAFQSFQNQQIDITTNIFHLAKSTYNNVLVKGILHRGGSAVYHGLISIGKKAEKTDSYLSNHSLHLSENCETNSVPSLKIENNNVKASHGSTVGQIDKDQLFYLMSRGLSMKEAENMLSEGFLRPIFDRFSQDVIFKVKNR